MTTGYLGLGSNVGDRLRWLRAARAMLERPGLRVVRESPVYETEALEGAAGQRDFLNACLEIATELGPEELYDACKATEHQLGRAAPARRHAPRAIDVDVLLLGDRGYRSPRLVLPHPGILQRRFVLVPLIDLDPNMRLPDGRALAGALDAVAGQRLERVAAL